MAKNSRSLPLGQEIRGFRIEKVLGAGGFGITYLAHDVKLNRKVAIKEYYPRDWAERDSKLRIRAVGNEEAIGTFKWGLEAFLQEAQLLARFAHPNIVAVSQLFETNGTAYLVMDYCDGQSLDEIIKERNGPLNEGELERIWHPLLNGLEQVHVTGFLHRDIKPANLYVRKDGSPVLLDFGSARQANPENNQGVTTLVADGYSPIEQYDANGRQGPYTDIYGLGATLYRAVTGIKPQVSTGRILNDTLERASIKAKGSYAINLLEAIDAAMAVRPKLRPQNIAEWRKIIDKPEITAPPRRHSSTRTNSPRVEPTLERKPVPIKVTLKVGSAADLAELIDNDKSSRPKPPPNADAGVLPAQQPSPLPVPPKAPSSSGTKWWGLLIWVFVCVVAYIWAGTQLDNSAERIPPEPAPPSRSEPAAPVLFGPEAKDCVECPDLRLIPAGKFTMGSPEGESGRNLNEGPQRIVYVDAFYATKYKITVKQWRACVSAGECSMPAENLAASDDMPMTHVSWFEVQHYVTWLSKQSNKTYQLLSEAQWEYAARAGNNSAYSFGAAKSRLDDYAWYKGNSDNRVHAVGKKLPNSYGLHDVHGNVKEWTADCWNHSYINAPAGDSIWNEGVCEMRVRRGGAWNDEAENLRSASRTFLVVNAGDETTGFRLARKPD